MRGELPIRRPAVAGQFYPGDADTLRKMIQEYLDMATVPEDLEPVRAIIAPHAGYIYSGPTAGYAFKALAALPQKKWTVFLLGPAHRAYFRGVALGDYSAFRTPLGDAPIAVDRVAEMVARSPFYTHAPEAHAPEHCLEVEVPFLQMTLPDFRLVPMLFGDVDPREVAGELADHIGEDDLIVVSSDLSHFYPYAKARQLDHALLEALLAGDEMGVLRGEACGRAPIVTLMGIARRKGWSPHLLDYRNSGDTAGDKWQVVGYASVAYTD
ncbi:MAG: AmmeMemoRadiSam system protein B [Chloroflexi bacterium]|nr:MAG: AmmeMemoRadiSam system protein B [Chloroflexota bacterium]HEY66674.1 AmmeMemoRadiSam system protein B [Thermoflexia bacterium]